MPYSELPPLPHDHAALEPHVSGRIVELHHGQHHATYAHDANEALERMAESGGDGVPDGLRQLERDLAFNLSGHLLHSGLWACTSIDGGGEPDGELAAAIDDQLGGFDRCRRLVTPEPARS